MNSRVTFPLLIVPFAILAGSAVYAQHKAGQYEAAASGKIELGRAPVCTPVT
jgi:hypothetical protein